MKYVYDITDEYYRKCLEFVNKGKSTHEDYGRDLPTKASHMLIGKLGEVGFASLLANKGITSSTEEAIEKYSPEMFTIYYDKTKGDITDFFMPNGKRIDVKSTGGNIGIQARLKHLQYSAQDYYVGVKVNLIKKQTEIIGYCTSNTPGWSGPQTVNNDERMYFDFTQMLDINNIINEYLDLVGKSAQTNRSKIEHFFS
jgi:hypothetical protein